MAALIDADGKPHFKYIVEGANLFLTQQARLHLEKRRVVLFKDSSANKGMHIYIFKTFLVDFLFFSFRWCYEFVFRGSRWFGAVDAGIRGPNDLQERQAVTLLRELRP